MSQEAAAPAAQEQFGVGKVLAKSFDVLGHNLVPFFVIALILQVPVALVEYFFQSGAMPDPANPATIDWGSYSSYMIGLLVVSSIVNGLMSATLVYGSFQYLRGQRASIGECFARGISVLVPVVITAIAFSLLMSLGFMLLLIPGLIIIVTYCLYAPAIVVEGKSIGGAFTRSAELTRGKRWPIFGLLLIYAIAIYAIGFLVVLVFGFVLPLENGLLLTLLNYAIGALFGAFSAVASSVMYYYLRADKEGVDIDQIASVFD